MARDSNETSFPVVAVVTVVGAAIVAGFVPVPHAGIYALIVIVIAAAEDGEALTKEIYGDEVIWTEWQRPGFDLGLLMRDVIAENPQATGIMMGQHGIINWADDDKE